jgi:hypothetical protein
MRGAEHVASMHRAMSSLVKIIFTAPPDLAKALQAYAY